MLSQRPYSSLAVTVLALAAAGAGTGIAVASRSNGNPHPRAAEAVGVQPAVLDAFAAFRGPAAVATDGSSRRSLQAAVGRTGGDGSPAATADFALAQPVAVAGSSADAWIAPSGSDVCTYLKDPVDGYGTACSTIEEVRAGGDTLTLAGGAPNSPVILAAVIQDGGRAPEVIHGDGSVTALAVQSNVAAAVLPTTDTVRIAGRSIDLARFEPPVRVRFLP